MKTNKRKLYIIGNGFDRAHGLNTAYTDFYAFLCNQHKDFIESLCEFYPILEDEDKWSCFEESVSHLNVDNFTESFDSPNYASDDFRDADYHQNEILVENELENTYNRLKSLFTYWIDIASQEAISHCFNIDRNAFFLTFNYTDTLERGYGIPETQVLHIHNKLRVDSPLIFGHNYKSEEWSKLNLPVCYSRNGSNELNEEESYDLDYAVERGYDAIVQFYKKTRKEPQINIKNNSDFWNKIETIEEIVVFGATLENGDEEYIHHITTLINIDKVNWHLYYFKNCEKKAIKNRLINAGVPNEKIHTNCSKDLPLNYKL